MNRFKTIVEIESQKEYYQKLHKIIDQEYQTKTIYPPKQQIFRALNLCNFDDVKVVILGQDPYHGPNQANGLSFSVEAGTKLPPSLRNIFNELVEDIKCEYPSSGDLSKWGKQGVLLLNTTLTVKEGQPMSHVGIGWETFTDAVLRYLNEKSTPIVFILWGKHAQSKKKLIDQNKHFVIESAHPSPLSARRGFFGSSPFSKTNEFLISKGLEPIDWSLN